MYKIKINYLKLIFIYKYINQNDVSTRTNPARNF